VGCGDSETFGPDAQRTVSAAIGRTLSASKAKVATFVADGLCVNAEAMATFMEFLARDTMTSSYHYTATIG